MNELFMGINSGTSRDAIDAALFTFTTDGACLHATGTHAFPAPLRSRLEALEQGKSTLDWPGVGELNATLGQCYGKLAAELAAQYGGMHTPIRAIGCHGQTVYHNPDQQPAYSLQLNDPARVAWQSGIDTVSDFRSADIAAGGQGAPLAPAFHRAFFYEKPATAVLNIGGIANLSILEPHHTRGFDTGPGNCLMDAWIQYHQGAAMDDNGAWAASGRIQPDLLEALLQDPYFQRFPPKSTGTDYFNLHWLQYYLKATATDYHPADIQATLCELSALSIARALHQHSRNCRKLLICGGGAHNPTLCERLAAHIAPAELESTQAFGIPPQWVECALFAWLAQRYCQRRPTALSTITGGSDQQILGQCACAPL